MSILFFDKEGKSIDQPKWFGLITNLKYPHIERHTWGSICIETSWIGIHLPGIEDKPCMFVTAVCDGDQENYRWHTGTLAQARNYHFLAAKKLKVPATPPAAMK